MGKVMLSKYYSNWNLEKSICRTTIMRRSVINSIQKQPFSHCTRSRWLRTASSRQVSSPSDTSAFYTLLVVFKAHRFQTSGSCTNFNQLCHRLSILQMRPTRSSLASGPFASRISYLKTSTKNSVLSDPLPSMTSILARFSSSEIVHLVVLLGTQIPHRRALGVG